MMINADETIADLEAQISAWRSAEYLALRQHDRVAAREYRIRAETLEQAVRNLCEQQPIAVRR